MKKIYIKWSEFDKMVNKIEKDIKLLNYKYDGIYGLPRGGLTLAVCLSHRLKLPLLLHSTKKTLVVDDISDTGNALKNINHKTIATLHNTNWTITPPDIFCKYKLSKDNWIIYPWESDK